MVELPKFSFRTKFFKVAFGVFSALMILGSYGFNYSSAVMLQKGAEANWGGAFSCYGVSVAMIIIVSTIFLLVLNINEIRIDKVAILVVFFDAAIMALTTITICVECLQTFDWTRDPIKVDKFFNVGWGLMFLGAVFLAIAIFFIAGILSEFCGLNGKTTTVFGFLAVTISFYGYTVLMIVFGALYNVNSILIAGSVLVGLSLVAVVSLVCKN